MSRVSAAAPPAEWEPSVSCSRDLPSLTRACETAALRGRRLPRAHLHHHGRRRLRRRADGRGRAREESRGVSRLPALPVRAIMPGAPRRRGSAGERKPPERGHADALDGRRHRPGEDSRRGNAQGDGPAARARAARPRAGSRREGRRRLGGRVEGVDRRREPRKKSGGRRAETSGGEDRSRQGQARDARQEIDRGGHVAGGEVDRLRLHGADEGPEETRPRLRARVLYFRGPRGRSSPRRRRDPLANRRSTSRAGRWASRTGTSS